MICHIHLKLMFAMIIFRSMPERVHCRVKKWTKHVDLFSKDYIVIPICDRYFHQVYECCCCAIVAAVLVIFFLFFFCCFCYILALAKSIAATIIFVVVVCLFSVVFLVYVTA